MAAVARADQYDIQPWNYDDSPTLGRFSQSDARIGDIIAEMSELLAESTRRLRTSRDLLLSRLMSGEIAV